MFVRKALTGALTVALAGSAVVLSAPTAHADPDDTAFAAAAGDVVGVGSDTSQNAMFRLANSYNAGRTSGRLSTFAATGGGNITLPSGSIGRPNGSGAGKALLYGAGNNTDVDFARSSSSLNTAEVGAGLRQFPFALDTLQMAVSNDVDSNAPASLTAAQIVEIYKGNITNWSALGGTPGVIAPKIPQAGSGTRSFFVAQLQAANGGVAVTLAASVQDVQEHDPAPVRNNANAIAPFSVGRAGLAGTALELLGGFSADRALYSVIRSADLGNATLQGLFGINGFLCSDGAQDEIEAAGFDQLATPASGGVCGQATQAATSNFTLSGPAVPIRTTVTVSGTSPSPRALRLTARVAGSPTPTGKVRFVDARGAVLGTAGLIGGTATLNLSNRAPGAYTVTASYTPDADTTFVASSARGVARVKTTSSVRESFKASVARKANTAKGIVTVTLAGSSTKPTGRVTVKEGRKTVGTGILRAGKAKVTLKQKKVGTGRSRLTITFAGDANGFGSSKTFRINFKR